MSLVKIANKLPKLNGKLFGMRSPYPALAPYTIRLKYRNGVTPTFPLGEGTQIDSVNNVWDLTYVNSAWNKKSSVGWKSPCSDQLDLIEVLDANIVDVIVLSDLFAGCRNLKAINLFDIHNCTSMNYTFSDCFSLTSVPEFNTSNVENLSESFTNCKSISSFPSLDLSNVHGSMLRTFKGCSSLTSVGVLNTVNVESFQETFHDCVNLVEIKGLDFTECYNLYATFANCTQLNDAPFINSTAMAKWSFGSRMDFMFENCINLKNFPGFLSTSGCTGAKGMFSECHSLSSAPLFDTSTVTSMSSMFKGCSSLTSVPLYSTDNVKNMDSMFSGCYNVQNGASALYKQASTQTNPPTGHNQTFYRCGINTTQGAAELARIPSDWK